MPAAIDPRSRRERKKLDTTRALATAAQELVAARGLDAVTVEDIAEAADVSVRTFFNHFPCKEDALVGIEPAALTELAQLLRDRPADEAPVDALRAVLLADVADDGTLRRWRLRNELVARYPALLPRHLATMVRLEEVLAGALADRLGLDAAADPRPRVVAAAAMAVLRSTFAWWEASDRARPLADLLDELFTQLVPDPTLPPSRRKR